MEPEVPLDILHDILVSFPVKTLSRLRCVGKPWNSLISNSPFQEDHYRQRSELDPLILVVQYKADELSQRAALHLSSYYSLELTLVSNFFIPLPWVNSSIDFCHIKSCEGLICLDFYYSIYRYSIYICNPATQEVITLPPSTRRNATRRVGFGYSVSTKEFKVVKYSYIFDGDVCWCDIFTLGTDVDWREARIPPFKSRIGSDVVFHDGAFHLEPEVEYDIEGGYYMAAFDIDKEDYRVITLPDHYKMYYSLTTLRGSLCLVKPSVFDAEIWLLKDKNTMEWVKEFSINLSYYFWKVYSFATMGNGRIWIGVITSANHNIDVICYNPNEKTLIPWKITGICAVTSYVERLIPLGSRTCKLQQRTTRNTRGGGEDEGSSCTLVTLAIFFVLGIIYIFHIVSSW